MNLTPGKKQDGFWNFKYDILFRGDKVFDLHNPGEGNLTSVVELMNRAYTAGFCEGRLE